MEARWVIGRIIGGTGDIPPPITQPNDVGKEGRTLALELPIED